MALQRHCRISYRKACSSVYFFSFLIFLLLSVPYTLTLMFIQWFQQFSHYHLLFWVHRLMPLFDAYTGPYKAKHRYWVGLLLLVRGIFLPIFVINFTNNPGSNLLAISVMSSILLAGLTFAGSVFLNNTLEVVSLLTFCIYTLYYLYRTKQGCNYVHFNLCCFYCLYYSRTSSCWLTTNVPEEGLYHFLFQLFPKELAVVTTIRVILL